MKVTWLVDSGCPEVRIITVNKVAAHKGCILVQIAHGERVVRGLVADRQAAHISGQLDGIRHLLGARTDLEFAILKVEALSRVLGRTVDQRRTIAQLAASDEKFLAGLCRMFDATFGDKIPQPARLEVVEQERDVLRLRATPAYFAAFKAECEKAFVK